MTFSTSTNENSARSPAAGAPPPRAWGRWGCISALALLVAMGLMVYPAIRNAREAARRSECKGDLFSLQFALRNYHETYGCFPPPYISDADGRPMHSWRVLVLPFLGRAELYEDYRFDEPWNGPNNCKLAAKVSQWAFHCDSDEPVWKAPDALMTNFLAVVGPGMAWQEGKFTRLSDITDDPDSTLLLVEVANSGVHWMEPRDLHVLQMAPAINPKGGQGISSRHPGGAHAATAGGHVRFLSDKLPAATVRGLLTINGGEQISEHDF
jgi:prepilin-type processing-associated H-X9-DG protein